MAKRVDNNQTEIVRTLRAVGAFVQSLATVGKGVADLLVAFRGSWYVIEVKNPQARGKLRPGQVEWWEEAERVGQVSRIVVESSEDALKVIGAI